MFFSSGPVLRSVVGFRSWGGGAVFLGATCQAERQVNQFASKMKSEDELTFRLPIAFV